MEESTIWKGNSSNAVNFGTYLVCFLLCWLIVPILVAFWKWLENRNRVYEVTTERIRVTRGIFSKRTEELELYRVKDTTLEEPFLFRLFGAGNIIAATGDQSAPRLTLEAIKNPAPLREQIRKSVEQCRERKGVRITEFES